MKTTVLCVFLASLLGCGLVSAQSSAPPPPASAPPVDTSMPPTPSTPPVNTNAPSVNTTPPPIGTAQNNGQPNRDTQQDVPRDANGNPLPSTGTMTGARQNSQPAAPQPLDFGMLDTDKAGALKIDQARNDAWLSRNFADCDANHNDEVTKSEYEKCTGR